MPKYHHSSQVVGALATVLLAGLPRGAFSVNQTVFISPKSFNVQSNSTAFRTSSYEQLFNPTNTSTPVFQIFHPSFLDIIGSNASIYQIASAGEGGGEFAHEAPVFVKDTDEVFFASNGGSEKERNNVVWKINVGEAEELISKARAQGRDKGFVSVNTTVTQVPLDESIQKTNGGTGLYQGNIIFSNSGRDSDSGATYPPNIALVNPREPYNSTVILNNFYGRQFNSLNDIKIYPPGDSQSGVVYFVDDLYGSLSGVRDPPLLAKTQVYRFDMETGDVRAVADGFGQANGLAFSGDGMVAYVADTGTALGPAGVDPTGPASIYAFDVDSESGFFSNRRLFAYVDAGWPDGVQVDTEGNVYTSCADGVQVFSPKGTLLGKIFLNTLSANFIFAPPNRMVILAETKIYLAYIAAKGVV